MIYGHQTSTSKLCLCKRNSFEKRALFDVDFDIPSHTYQAIIGHTGSGKSTILQHFNALLRPTSGEVHIGIA